MFFDRLPAMFLVLSLSATASTNLSIDEAWEGFSSPEILGSGFTHSLYSLPLEGATYWEGPKHWSSDYWANKNGGINYRWNGRNKTGFNLRSPSYNELRRSSIRDLQGLSPAEKYDILTGQYDYPLVKEVASKVSPKAEEWEGICHGWVVAAIHHDEPKPKILRNRDGIDVPFGSADIKALLSYFYAEDKGPAQNLGLRCNFGTWTGGQKECNQDLNAGAFHIIIANKLALQNQGVIMDVDRFKEVWNQPVIGYRSSIAGPYSPTRTAARTAVAEYRVKTELYYIVETDPTWNTVHGTKSQAMEKKHLTYRIEVNSHNEIVGGTWESKDRPDFIWQKPKATSFPGMFSMLPQLLNDSAGESRRHERRTYEDDYRRPREERNEEWDYSGYGNSNDPYESRDGRYYRRRPVNNSYRNYYWNPYLGRWEYRYSNQGE